MRVFIVTEDQLNYIVCKAGRAAVDTGVILERLDNRVLNVLVSLGALKEIPNEETNNAN